MDTDHNAPWRSARFTVKPTDKSGARMVKPNYNFLADNAGADVAMRYLRTRIGNSKSGSINNTGLAKELAGSDVGAALIRAFGDTVEGGTATKNAVGLGSDWKRPSITVSDDGKMVHDGSNIYTLPVTDMTMIEEKPWWVK